MKLFRQGYSVIVLSLIFLFTACEDQTTCCQLAVPYPTLTQYASIEVGDEKIYQIDSIKYDDFSNTVDTLTHWRREVTVETFRDLENRLNYRQEIYVRNDSTASWRRIKVRSVFIDESVLALKEDNLTKIKLRFPLKVGKNWDANLMNTLAEQNFTYKSLTANENLGWKYFSTLLLVNQIDEENLIEKKFAEEKYAPSYGLISRRDLNITTSFNGDILSGYDCKWKLQE